MRLGATISSYFKSTDPDAYVAECVKWGYRSAPCPEVQIGEVEKIRAISRAFSQADITLGEVHAWFSAIDSRPEKRKEHRKRIAEGLAIADELDAVCCLTVAGTLDTRDHIACDTPDPKNFTQDTFDAVVEWVREVLNEAKPRRTKLALEMSPWTPLDGVEAYRQIIDAVAHPALAVHLDPANAILTPRLLWSTTDLLNHCFDLLGEWIISCHAKDLFYSPAVLDCRHVNLVERIPGQGVLDYRTFLRRVEQISSDMPLIMEHQPTVEAYAQGAAYIRSVAQEVGAST